MPVKENDFVYITDDAAQQLPDLAKQMWRGGLIKRIGEDGIAEVHVTRVERIHISKLVDPLSPNAYDGDIQ